MIDFMMYFMIADASKVTVRDASKVTIIHDHKSSFKRIDR